MTRKLLVLTVVSCACLLGPFPKTVRAQDTGATLEAAKFDPVAATESYLARIPAGKRAQSDAYFEGGYWLQLWDFVIGVGLAYLLLAGRWSAGMRDSG